MNFYILQTTLLFWKHLHNCHGSEPNNNIFSPLQNNFWHTPFYPRARTLFQKQNHYNLDKIGEWEETPCAITLSGQGLGEVEQPLPITHKEFQVETHSLEKAEREQTVRTRLQQKKQFAISITELLLWYHNTLFKQLITNLLNIRASLRLLEIVA